MRRPFAALVPTSMPSRLMAINHGHWVCRSMAWTCTVAAVSEPTPRRRVPAASTHEDRLAGRVAIITGASTGIGAAVAELFVELGAAIVVMARRPGPLASMAARLPADRVTVVPGDVAVEA